MTKRHSPWTLVAMLCATGTVSYMCRANLSTTGILVMEEFNLTQVHMGWIISSFLLGYALFQIPAGLLTDRIGAKRILTWAVFLWAALTIMQSVAGSGILPISASAVTLTLFVIFRFLLGVSESPTFPAAGLGVSRWIPPQYRGRANGIVIASIGLGSAITPILVSNIMVDWGWRIAVLATSVPALIVAMLWLRIRVPAIAVTEPANKIIEAEVPAQEKSALRSRSFILLTLSYTLEGYVAYIFVTWFYIYLVQERHFGLLTGAWMSSLPWILSIVSIPLGGLIFDWLIARKLRSAWNYRLVPILGLALSGILISMGAHTSSPIVAAISLAFATAFILCIESPFWSVMIGIAGRQSGTGGGIMNMGANIGGFISPTLTPLIASYIGWENALHVAALLAMIGAALWLGIHPNVSKANQIREV